MKTYFLFAAALADIDSGGLCQCDPVTGPRGMPTQTVLTTKNAYINNRYMARPILEPVYTGKTVKAEKAQFVKI